MLIAQLLLCRFLQSFPPGGLRLSHLPRQLVLSSLQRSGSRRIPATYADGYFRYIAESVVNADFTEAKRNRQDAKNKCCILLFIGICCTGNCPGVFLSCFKLCERGVIPVLVNTRTVT
jgi:hypothetical protein